MLEFDFGKGVRTLISPKRDAFIGPPICGIGVKVFYQFDQLTQLVKPHVSMLGNCFLAELFVGGDVFRE